MLRLDLPAADIPTTKPAAGGGGLVVSLYSLLHSVPALLEANGATLREVMTFMRHSTPVLTLKTYGRLGRAELSAVAGNMPLLVADTPAASPKTAPLDSERGFLRTVEETSAGEGKPGESSQGLELQAVGEQLRGVEER